MNEHGEPVGDSVRWCETPIECLISPNSDTRLGKYEDGEFRQASYAVLIESQEFNAERVMLIRNGEELGDFRVISITALTVGRVQILV